ncbi:hypothetical protein [Chitinophaga filiformis]|uniref:Uncharacterized protein n=1 Tax=Chitinophaga filiformis TaxID=104663 RepID=A0A1G7NNC3_CHIFI|nr:hypothetical protein [Chitinophaga filiformis]SDF75568.1 hypothetical protein SAMN04488121_102873 [Chitinophaga filiformis]
MLDQDFYQFLEYEICKAFQHSNNEEIKGFWCDGVLPFATGHSYSQKSIHDSRKITLKAFIGKDGQSEYELVLKLGNKALSRHARNLDIKECIPDPEEVDWLDIDIKKRRLEIQLD